MQGASKTDKSWAPGRRDASAVGYLLFLQEQIKGISIIMRGSLGRRCTWWPRKQEFGTGSP
jgi:hypothetical protein